MTALTSVELTKLFRRPPVWVLLGAMAVLLAGLTLLIALSAPPEVGERPSALELAVPFAIIGGQVLAALVGAALAQEYQWRTLPLWLSRGTARAPLLVARVLAALPALVLVVAVTIGVGLLLSLGDLSGALAASGMTLGTLWLVVLAAAYGLLPYLALALALAVATRAVAAPVGGVLLLALLVEPLLGQLAPAVSTYLPSSLTRVLLAGGEPGRGVAALVLALLTAAILLGTAWAFRRQDLTA
jgi:ABC-type transport system involved in multi-copper enzyme maturation permease subunit